MGKENAVGSKYARRFPERKQSVQTGRMNKKELVAQAREIGLPVFFQLDQTLIGLIFNASLKLTMLIPSQEFFAYSGWFSNQQTRRNR